eukprot:TRINITY_DN16808_c0_g1_i1.p1 TRINITY_DN16808_c0_g1~~TRINITY_DN16808_c0_g1_i1.p1  ORF type:complete len:193 (+),score=32.25 TRINITY_DN16808_c0_g1_i1:56-634(+)
MPFRGHSMVGAGFSEECEGRQRIEMQAPKFNQVDEGETARCEHDVPSGKKVAFLQYREALTLRYSFWRERRCQPKQNENDLRAAWQRDGLLTASDLSCDRVCSFEGTAAGSKSAAAVFSDADGFSGLCVEIGAVHEEQQDMRDVGMSEIDFIKFVKTEAARMTASHSSAFSMTSNLKESSLLKRREKAKVSS